jgi:ABC-type transporter Mla subunit MlaD
MPNTKHNQHLDSTIESLGRGIAEAKTGATRSINSWIEALSEGSDYKEVSDALEHLKDLLSEKDPNGTQIAKALKSLGDKTKKAAKDAEGATADKIQELGDILVQASHELDGDGKSGKEADEKDGERAKSSKSK